MIYRFFHHLQMFIVSTKECFVTKGESNTKVIKSSLWCRIGGDREDLRWLFPNYATELSANRIRILHEVFFSKSVFIFWVYFPEANSGNMIKLINLVGKFSAKIILKTWVLFARDIFDITKVLYRCMHLLLSWTSIPIDLWVLYIHLHEASQNSCFRTNDGSNQEK